MQPFGWLWPRVDWVAATAAAARDCRNLRRSGRRQDWRLAQEITAENNDRGCGQYCKIKVAGNAHDAWGPRCCIIFSHEEPLRLSFRTLLALYFAVFLPLKLPVRSVSVRTFINETYLQELWALKACCNDILAAMRLFYFNGERTLFGGCHCASVCSSDKAALFWLPEAVLPAKVSRRC